MNYLNNASYKAFMYDRPGYTKSVQYLVIKAALRTALGTPGLLMSFTKFQ